MLFLFLGRGLGASVTETALKAKLAMNADFLFRAACFAVVLVVGFASCFVAFTTRGRVAPHWVRVALWLLCPVATTWSVLGFVLLFCAVSLPEHTYYFVRHIKSLFGGVGIGILLLLLISGD